ncbi:hypothetical protein CEE45_14485 [Candidatus Heimdallarchaeota archaeon B3_Heim]|nr:MAG: hypothetical protein CEE45_14485 [Candidatus Heimdallarchaeota archaeon B3_Heim]
MSIKEKVSRIPWKEYLSKQMVKIIGLLLITFLLIIVMIISVGIEDLSTVTYGNTEYVVAIVLSTLCFFLVLIGFSKIVLFDMADEFGLRDESGKMMYNSRFWLFTLLALSFCSAIYLLLDVFLQETYLQLLPVIFMRGILDYFELDIENLSDVDGRKFYETARNLYFGGFFLLIIAFSIIVFLIILTTFARRRVVRKFKKEEEVEEKEKEGIKTIYKLFAWILIPFLAFFVIALQNTSIGPIVTIGYLLAAIWWIYQVLKVIFQIVWGGVKITAFITSVNLLVIIPLIATLWLLPTFLWGIWDTVQAVTDSSFTMPELTNLFVDSIITRLVDFNNLIQLDFIIITIIATLVVGFAEGFAIIAIFSALSRGIEVARSGQVLARSPPKVMVFSKYLVMLGVWVSLLWDSFGAIIEMLKNQINLNIQLTVPNFFHLLYNQVVLPISDYLAKNWSTLEYLPYLILPIIFIFSGAFKFLSVALVTPKVKDRGEVFFLLVSTSFVLIITNILGDIYELAIPDAPLRSLSGLTTILSSAVGTFENVESVAFYGGFLFGIVFMLWKAIKRESTPTSTSAPTDDSTLPSIDTPTKESVIKETTILVDIEDAEPDETLDLELSSGKEEAENVEQ